MDKIISKIQTGKVVSNKMMNTITVAVIRRFPHPKYGKIVYKTKKFHVNTDQKIEVGQEVKFRPSRKISKTKSFELIK
jgi:small subunit ribosomal protein S17